MTNESLALTTRQTANLRTRILKRATALVNRLGRIAMGEEQGTMQELKAIQIYLDKCLPNLKHSEHTGAISHEHSLVAILASLPQATARNRLLPEEKVIEPEDYPQNH